MALTIKVVFGFQHLEIDGVLTHDTVNPNGPSALMFAWMGPFIGALIRPVGGMIADKLGGARVASMLNVLNGARDSVKNQTALGTAEGGRTEKIAGFLNRMGKVRKQVEVSG